MSSDPRLQRSVDELRNQVVGKLRTLTVLTTRHDTQIKDLAAIAQSSQDAYLTETVKTLINDQVAATIRAEIDRILVEKTPEIVEDIGKRLAEMFLQPVTKAQRTKKKS